MNIISGENFQSLSQISFCTDRSDIIINQLKQIPQNLFCINEFSIESIKEYNIIFCYTHDLDVFLNKFFPYLNDNIILISHNSDNFIDLKYIEYLNSDKIKKWFCQNRYINHPKLFSLPIGLANSQWPHGNKDIFLNIKNENNKKENLVYKNFDIGTNINARIYCNEITNRLGIYMSPHDTNENYWRSISKSFFTISPHGNGVDCHRIWECLYLESVPIVQYHECFSQFKHLPILFVDDFKDVTREFLQKQINNFYPFSKWNLDMLSLNYWKERLNE